MFNINRFTPSQIASMINKKDIAVRSGFHCSPLAHKQLETGENGAIRISFSVFNSRNDIIYLYDTLNEIIKGNP